MGYKTIGHRKNQMKKKKINFAPEILSAVTSWIHSLWLECWWSFYEYIHSEVDVRHQKEAYFLKKPN